MKKKFLGRVLTMLLVASMVFTLLPAPAIAAGNWWWNTDEYTEEAVPTATTDDYDRILHLDCGRKYFTKDWIIALMTEAKAAGYNQVQLAFGNKGLRFLLEDMSVLSYTGQQVKDAIHAGNEAYHDFPVDELTQADMDDILTAAAALELDVIPLFNTPFHMEAVITAMEELGITDSYFTQVNGVPESGCLNLSNEDAVNFVKALMQKYVNYFRGKNCKYFSFGADEYTGGWNNIFYSYAGGIASMIKTAGMTPRVFNDSYRSGSTTYIDGVDQVCYWYTGYSGNMYSSAATLKRAGKQLINTNKDYYYVVSKNQITQWNSPEIQYVFSGPYDEATWINKANEFDRNTFNNWANINRTSVISDGSMFCIWCDNPGAKDETQIAKETRMILRVMAARMQNSYDYQGADVLVDGGFDADGRIYHKDIKDNKDIKDIYVTVGQPYTETIDGNYPGPYEIAKPDIATVTGNVIPGTTTSPTLGDKYTLYGDSSISTATGVISDGSNNNFLKVSGESLTNTTKIEEATKFTVKKTSTNKATIQVTDTNSYLKLMNTSGITSSIMAVEELYEWEVGSGSNFCWYAGYNNYYYLAYYGEKWTSNSNWSYAGYLYEVNTDTTSTADKTELTFTGLKRGDTEVTVGNVTYKVHVTDALADNGDLYVDFWVTSNPVTPNGITTTDSGTNEARRVYATYSPAEFNSEQGVLLSEKMPKTGSYAAQGQTFTVSYWKTRYLPEGYRQMAKGWTNKNGVGTDTETGKVGGRDIEYIRYWDNKWEYRTVGSTEWAEFTTSADATGNQIAAYYLIKTDITNEVTTSVTDWTDPHNTSFWGVALDFCVKYPSSTDRVPNSFGKGQKTQWFNCVGEANLQHDSYKNGYCLVVNDDTREKTVGSWQGLRTSYPSQGDWYRVINYIDVTEDQGYEVYMITATPSESFNDASPETGKDDCPDTISYTGTERVLWAESESVWEVSGLEKHSDYKVGGDPLIERVMIQQCSGMLLTYYVRPKEVKNPLTVYFMVDGSNTEITHYQIAPKTAAKFDENIDLPTTDNGIGDLQNATILNDKNVSQTVTSDLTKVPSVPAKYRRTTFECVRLEKSEDGTTIYLYYTFDNSAAFVIDFGLQLKITPGDVNDNLKTAKITKAAASNTGNKVKVNTDDPNNIVITPTQAFVSEKEAVTFSLTYTGTKPGESNEDTASYLITILPASNVLYEENFLTEAPASSGRSWTEVTPNKLGSQETQKVNGTGSYNVFGRDAAYDTITGALGVWTATGLVAGQGATKDLSTEFYGNGFDLIGNCGPDTGRVFLFISGANQIKLVDVDTRYSGGTFNQVPLAHVMLEQEANYQVKVSAAGLNATDATSASYSLSGAATYASDYAVGGYDADLYNVLAENGLTMADVEYVKVESAPAATASGAASFYALDTAAVGGTVAHKAGTHVEIDGFRVYRSSANNTNYPKSEQDVRYLNILDAVDSFTAFVEGSAADSEWKARDKYESAGGPQNEIYLRETNGKNSAIAFKTEIGEVVQISARAVENNKPATLFVNGVATVIETNTEMYYTFTPDENGIVTIKNTGKGMLALGNLKIKKGTQVAALSEEDYPAAIALLSLNAAPETPDEGFNPAINAKVTTTRFIRSKVVTLTVSASSDVAVLEVNGVELRPTNSWLVKMGWSDTYTYILTEKVQKNEIKTYEIVGYRADGAASETIVVKSK